MNGRFKGDWGAILLLILLFLLAEVLINPIGEFPLNDDWSYTRSLQHLYEMHHLRLGGFTSMPLVAQLEWGVLFCRIFGFSFTILRFSTLVLSLAGILSSYFLIRELSGSRKLSFSGALIVLFNPVYLNLSNTFMTDIPFLSMLLLSVLFFVKGLRRDRLVWIAAGVVFVVVATLIRQLGLLVALSFSVCYLLRKRPAVAFLSFFIPLGIYLFYNAWLKRYSFYPVMYDEGVKQIQYNLFHSNYPKGVFLFKQVLNIFIYSGFFLFPLVFVFNQRRMHREGKVYYYYAFFLLLASGYFLTFRRLMPYTGNIINAYGLGVVTLRDIMILKSAHLAVLPGVVWAGMTLAGCIGAGILLFVLVRSWPVIRWKGFVLQERPEVLFLFFFLMFYGVVMLVGASFDRYYIPLVPVVCALAGHVLSGYLPAPKVTYRLYAGVILLYGCFSVSLTHDYLSWNRARWKALNYLTADLNIPPERIDGGFEFNGYYLYDDTPMKLEADPAKKSWWWVKDDEYLISFGPVDGYTVVKEYPYRRWAGPERDIFILKRK